MAFPTKTLPGTDGSRDADLTARLAEDLSNSPGRNCMFYVGEAPPQLDLLAEEIKDADGDVCGSLP